jgi:hypothetical protein
VLERGLDDQFRADSSTSELGDEAIAALERLRHHDSPDTMQARVATDPRTLEYIRYYDSLGIGPYRLGTFATVEDARRWIAGGPRRTFVPRPGTNALEPTEVPLLATLDQ